MEFIYNGAIMNNLYAVKIRMENIENVAALIDGLVAHRLENLKITDDQATPIEQAMLTVVAECGNEESALITPFVFTIDELTKLAYTDKEVVNTMQSLSNSLNALVRTGVHAPFIMIREAAETFDEHDFYVVIFGISDKRPEYNFVVATINAKILYNELLQMHEEMDATQTNLIIPLFYKILNNKIISTVSTNAISMRTFVEKDDKADTVPDE